MMSRTLKTLSVGFRTLRTNPMRTVLSTLGVVIGVGSLVAILSVSDGLEQFSREQIERTTDLHSIVVFPKTVEILEGITVRKSDVQHLSVADAETLSAKLGERAAVSLTLVGSDRIALRADTTRVPTLVVGTLSNAPEVFSLALEAGRFLDDADVRTGRRVAVLSQKAAERLTRGLQLHTLLGQDVIIKGMEFCVVGVVSGGAGEGTASTYIPMTEQTFATLSRREGKAAQATIRVRMVEDVEHVRTEVESWLSQKAGPVDRHFVVSSSRQRVAQVEQAMMVFKLAMGSIAGISLLVGGIGIMNILLASVSERTREIGIRRAAGARARDILLQFLAESLAIAGLGSILGVVLGLIGSTVVTAVIRTLTEAPLESGFTWSSILVAVGAACLVGFTFGIYPARKASRLSPTDAIRYE